jgi:predicted restriction endonuclease
MSPYYHVALTGYAQFSSPLPVPILLAEYGDQIRNELVVTKPRFYPFVTNLDRIRTVQGIYLARCTPLLRQVLDQALQIAATPHEADELDPHATFREARRLAQESYFFSRNPALIREAKRRGGHKCEVCNFDFAAVYGELGSHFIEAHHLDPLSERSENDWTDELMTRVDRVAVLCSNCHRMIHRHRPALTLDELRFAISTASQLRS